MTQNIDRSMNNDQKIRGCGTIALLAFLSLWVIVISLIDMFSNWALEQNIFESATSVSDIRWLDHGVCALLLFVSLLIAFLLVKTPRLKLALRLWTIAAGVAVLMTPIKRFFITDQQQTAAVQLLILLFCSLGLFIFQSIKKQSRTNGIGKSGMIGITALVAAGMFIPWLLWGALGSIDDTVIYVMLGGIFGLFTVQVLYPFLFEKTQTPERELTIADFLLDGFIVALFFLIEMTGLAQNGSQLLLIIVMPISAWVIVAFAILGRSSSDQAKISVGMIAGLSLALPLLWFDADELSLAVNGTPGETVEWATRSAWTMMGVLLFVVLLFVINFRSIGRLHPTKKINIALSVISVAAVVVVYLAFGRPGFYGDKIFVVMKNQADLTSVSRLDDLSSRREAVYTTLVKTATDSQAGIRQQLQQWHLSYTPYYLVNGLEVNAGPFFTMLIQRRSDVDRILQSPQLRPLPKQPPLTNSDAVSQPAEFSWNLKMIKVDQVRQELGVTGKGIVIGETDTGVDGYHPELAGSYRGADSGDDYNWLDPWNKSIFPTDVGGHGTATLGLITGKNIGIAPDAKWIGCVNLARDLGNPAVYLNCMQFMLAPFPQNGNAFTDGKPDKGAMIVNNSWGCPEVEGCDAAIYKSTVGALETAGIFMSVAAGNTGNYGCSTVTDPPAIYSETFTAGSINEAGNVSEFSSLGPVTVDGSGRTKPDILAPGEGIISSFPNKAYMQGDGTSFAAPHVTGVVALMWSANPKLIGNISLTKKILDDTASPYTGKMPECVTSKDVPNNAAGYGVLNAYAAVKEALAVK